MNAKNAGKTLPSPGEGRDGEGSSTSGPTATASAAREWPLWEVFVRSKSGLDHKHCGSLHASDAKMAIQMARDVYTRRQEGTSVWVVRSENIAASTRDEKDPFFDPSADKVYRHPTFYQLPASVDHM